MEVYEIEEEIEVMGKLRGEEKKIESTGDKEVKKMMNQRRRYMYSRAKEQRRYEKSRVDKR